MIEATLVDVPLCEPACSVLAASMANSCGAATELSIPVCQPAVSVFNASMAGSCAKASVISEMSPVIQEPEVVVEDIEQSEEVAEIS